MRFLKDIFKTIVTELLILEARLVLKKYKPRVVAVTGSVGKTSTKDAIYAALKDSLYVRKSEKSYNSEIGVPLTILGCPNAWSNPIQWLKNLWEGIELILLPNHYPKWLVLEVGVDRPGDIHRLIKWIPVDVAVFTRFPEIPVHVEFFESPEAVIEEKLKLLEGLKSDGTLIYNADDPILKKHLASETHKKITYGVESGDIRAQGYSIRYEEALPVGIDAVIDGHAIFLKEVLGRQQLYTLLAAFSVVRALLIPSEKALSAFESYVAPPGRMRIIKGINKSVLIDDTYNSSPIAVEEALNVLEETQAKGRKIVLFGDMLELGSHTMEAHKNAGKAIQKVADLLLTVGVRSHATAESAHRAKMKKKSIIEYKRAEEVGRDLREILEEGDVVLIKGSQSIRMEKILGSLMAEPERAKELLVRQEDYWLRR
ncbi:MAG: UDP-N-acetylmuramoyl-tripeptide--D-alanyl-D-alanine ligase [Candidatus Paceibacterota bacterium]